MSVLLGTVACEPPDSALFAENATSIALSVKADMEGTDTQLGLTIEPGQRAPIMSFRGMPPAANLVFLGERCTQVPIFAIDAEGQEVARHPPGLCINETWVMTDQR